MTDRQPSDFRFVIRQTHASPAADSTSPTVVDTLDDRVVAVFDANDAAVAVSEVLEAAHDVGVALRLTLGQATDPAPLAKVGDVLREAAAGVLANPLPAIGDRGGLGEALLTVLCLERRVVESEPEVAKDLARVRHEIAALRAQLAAEKEHAAGAISAYRATLARLTDVEKEIAAEKARADQCALLAAAQGKVARDALARADNLSRMVAAMGEHIDRLIPLAEHAMQPESHDGPCGFESCDGICVDNARVSRAMHDAQDLLSRPDVAAERGRWKTVEEHEQLVSEYRRIIRSLTEQRDDAIDCCQANVCAKPPGCQRHWAERNAELVRERDAAIAAKEKAEAFAHFACCGGNDDLTNQHHTMDCPEVAARAALGLKKVERSRDEWKARAESAELGCDIAYRREPTQEEGDAHEDKQHQSMGPDLPTGECFVAMGGWTGRRCRHCARWVWGGPTACAVCVERASRDELGIQLAAQAERLRLAMDAVRKLKAFRDGICFDVVGRPRVSDGVDISDLWIQQRAALAALDAVPGDALSRDIGPALDRAHEASGVVTGAPFDEPQNGVKVVE